MSFIQVFAHAGEDHESTAQSVAHSILNEWWAALIIYIALLLILVVGTYYISKKSTGAAFGMLLAGLLVGGISMYSISPAVSIFALTTGFVIALGSMFVGVGSSDA